MGGIIKMKFSKKSRYGLTSLIDLSVHSKNGHVALNSIAERNDISPQYLEQVFAALRRAGIVKSIKGPQGGYLLNHRQRKLLWLRFWKPWMELITLQMKIRQKRVTVKELQRPFRHG